MGQSAGCLHVGFDLLFLNGIWGGAGCRALWKPTWQANPRFTYCCHLKPNLWQNPLKVYGCFASACASICVWVYENFICLYVNIMTFSLSFNSHSDARWLTDLLLHSRVQLHCVSVCVVSLLVICGWIKTLSIQQSFPSHPSRWWGHDCGLIITALRWEALIGNSGYFTICEGT